MINQENKLLLDGFSKYMQEHHLSERTIKRHMANIDFYINEFLPNGQNNSAIKGWSSVDYFFEEWLPTKGLCSSVNTLKENMGSLKKFYVYLYDLKEITKENYLMFLDLMKEGRETWIEALDDF